MLGLGPAPTCTPTVFPFPPFWFIFDVESIGLHGEAFAVAAQVFDHQARPLPLEGGWWHHFPRDFAAGTAKNRKWVDENVPDLGTHSLGTMRAIRDFFWDSWQEEKERHPGIVMAAECAWPVEARFLCAVIDDEPLLREFAGPCPLHDIASIMLAAGMDPMAAYKRVTCEYPVHHPLGDVQHSAHCLAMALAELRLRKAAQDANWERQVVGYFELKTSKTYE